jgi:hypothetical protein
MDLVSKLSQLFTLVFGLGAIMACQAPDHTCTERCYVDGVGFALGITVNVILGKYFDKSCIYIEFHIVNKSTLNFQCYVCVCFIANILGH